MVGAVLLTILPEALRQFGDWEVPLYGLVLIVVILFLPRGIAGLFARAETVAEALPVAERDPRAAAPAAGAPPAPLAAPGARPAAGGSAPLLEVRGVTKQFGGVRAVRECSFDVAEGEIKAVIGPNGAGKTTLFNVITGFYAPTAGAGAAARAVAHRPARPSRWPGSGSRARSRTSSSSRA